MKQYKRTASFVLPNIVAFFKIIYYLHTRPAANAACASSDMWGNGLQNHILRKYRIRHYIPRDTTFSSLTWVGRVILPV